MAREILSVHKLRIQIRLGLKPSWSHRLWLVDLSIRRDFAVSVQERPSVVDIFRHKSFDSAFIIWNVCTIIRSSVPSPSSSSVQPSVPTSSSSIYPSVPSSSSVIGPSVLSCLSRRRRRPLSVHPSRHRRPSSRPAVRLNYCLPNVE